MTAWQRLGIAPTTDLRQIKRAYAKQLKQIDQDTQAELFIELRQALNDAEYEARVLLHEQENADNDDEQLTSEQLIFADASNTEQSILQSNTAQTSTVQTDEFAVLIKQHYADLANNIQQRNISFDIKHALLHVSEILNQHTHHPLHDEYQQSIIDLLIQHDLEDFIHLIQQDASTLVTPIDTVVYEIDQNTDESSSDETANTPDVQQQTGSFKHLEKLSEALWNGDVSDAVFEQYQRLLNNKTELNLSEQIDLKDQLQAPLANLEIDIGNPDFSRFLKFVLAFHNTL